MTAPTTRPHVIWRLRLGTVCLALVALAFRQAPGLVSADTKLDLTVDPVAFMARSLHLWDPAGAFGQLQNQAYGYLLPMGPFFAIGHVMGLPAWVVQRLWWSLLLCVAFLGVVRLAGRWQIGAPWARVLAALAYALSPRVISELGSSSVEVWPMAMAPWVLLTLVNTRRSHRAAAAASGVAVALTGGVNAVATGVVLVLPALWLVTRPRGLALRRGAWWTLCVLLAIGWWLVPLALLGRYSPPFLDWIEDASVTTSTASLFQGLRGTSAWLAYLRGSDGPTWPAGWSLVTSGLLVVQTAAVAGIGLLGLTLRRTPHRRYLGLAVLVGMLLLTAGHVGPGGSFAAEGIQHLLDGALAAFRNVHKFDAVVRLPLVLGFAAAVSRLPELVHDALPRRVALLTVGAVLAGATAPALAGQLASAGSYPSIPGYWRSAAAWLDAQPAAGRVLVVPSASFAQFAWGQTRDEPLQALMKRGLAVRDAVPLGGAGSTRWLDEVERRLDVGDGSPGLREALRRAGVRYVVMRNDLSGAASPPRRVVVHEALARSGLRLVGGFGPAVGSGIETTSQTLDSHLALPYRAVEVFDAGPVAQDQLLPFDSAVVASGGPEDVLALADAGLAADRPVLLGTDALAYASVAGAGATTVMTDGLRRREVFFGRSRDNTSATLTAQDPGRQHRKVIDYDSDPAAPRTVASWTGVVAVRASSSGSDANATLRTGAGTGPAQAVDGDLSTRWVSGRFGVAVGEWIEVDLHRPTPIGSLTVAVSHQAPVGAAPVRATVTTDQGAVETSLTTSDEPQVLPVPKGATERVRLTFDAVGPGRVNGVSVSELRLDGVLPQQTLRVPGAPGGAAAVLLMRSSVQGSPGCVQVGARPLCAPALARAGEEDAVLDRTVALAQSATYGLSGTVVARDSTAVDALLLPPTGLRVTASSRAVEDPRGRPGAVADRDLGTGWVAAASDADPTLRLTWPHRRFLTGVQLLVDPYLAASRPQRVRIAVGGGPAIERTVDEQGYVRFPRTAARTLSLTVLTTTPVEDVDPGTGLRTRLPAGLSELRLLGADDLRRPLDPTAATGAACGFGPALSVDGQLVPTSVTGTIADLLSGGDLRWQTCQDAGGWLASAGTHRLSLRANAEFRPTTLIAVPGGPPTLKPLSGAAPGVAATRRVATATDRVLDLPERGAAQLLVMTENANPGWTATMSGVALRAIRVDGWRQGWIVPAGAASTVHVVFAPDRPYRLGLAAGALCLLVLVLLAVPLGGGSRRRAVVPDRDLRGSRRLALTACALVLLTAGSAGAVALAVVSLAGAAHLALRSGGTARDGAWRRWLPLLVGVPWALAAAWAGAFPWPGSDAALHSLVLQWLVALSLAALAVGLSADSVTRRSDPERPPSARRPLSMIGRSTQ